jgi:hypothetical protein
MLRESLPEYVAMARLAVETPTKGRTPSSFHGYPAAALLFAVADSIGSYYRANQGFVVDIDGRQCRINGDGYKHLFVFNSDLYGQSLSEKEIKALYDYYRNPLTHNSALAPGVLLNRGGVDDPVFYLDKERVVECVNVVGLLSITERAVDWFLQVAEDVVPKSHQASVSALKGASLRAAEEVPSKNGQPVSKAKKAK